jgi:hypothetical protein
MQIYLLRFASVAELGRALAELYDDLGVADCLVDCAAREMRVRAPHTRLAPHLERFYLRRALVWVTRHPPGGTPAALG